MYDYELHFPQMEEASESAPPTTYVAADVALTIQDETNNLPFEVSVGEAVGVLGITLIAGLCVRQVLSRHE